MIQPAVNSALLQTILFMHGLESGPGGNKHRYLIKTYPESEVLCPDMQMGVWRIDKANSFLRSLLISAPTLQPSTIFPNALKRSLDGCLDTHKPSLTLMSDGGGVVIGSSWGGAVALHAMAQGHWNGPTILIAPALELCLRKFVRGDRVEEESARIYAQVKASVKPGSCIIVHGGKGKFFIFM
jgi:hypothetical protein